MVRLHAISLEKILSRFSPPFPRGTGHLDYVAWHSNFSANTGTGLASVQKIIVIPFHRDSTLLPSKLSLYDSSLKVSKCMSHHCFDRVFSILGWIRGFDSPLRGRPTLTLSIPFLFLLPSFDPILILCFIGHVPLPFPLTVESRCLSVPYIPWT